MEITFFNVNKISVQNLCILNTFITVSGLGRTLNGGFLFMKHFMGWGIMSSAHRMNYLFELLILIFADNNSAHNKFFLIFIFNCGN